LAHARDVAAALAVDRDALAARDEADDRVGRRRLAAARETGHQPIDADDENAAARARRLALARDDAFLFRARRQCFGSADRADGLLQGAQVDLGARHGCEEVIDLRVSRLGGDRFELERGHARTRKLALDLLTAMRDRLLDLLRLEPLPHFRAGAVALHVAELRIEPVATWAN